MCIAVMVFIVHIVVDIQSAAKDEARMYSEAAKIVQNIRNLNKEDEYERV